MELKKREEIIKALEHCINDATCEQCIYSPSSCFINENALALIKELTEEIKDLEAEYDRVYEQAEADIHGNMADGGTSCHWCMDKTKADTVKRMQEMFSMHYGTYTNKDMVSVREVFVLLNQIAEDLLEERI